MCSYRNCITVDVLLSIYPCICIFCVITASSCIYQEVIKSISCKGYPIKNFFYFDAADGKGVIEDIPTPSAI
uniref:Uncharacterized protein n=1 Tax=Arundo donax TaxID=35708 RepID=A0A0A8ZJH4_ARUDO